MYNKTIIIVNGYIRTQCKSKVYLANDIIELIKKLDLNINLIESRINEKNIKKKLNKDIELANKLGLRGTPAFVIKDELIFGYIEYEEILSRLYN